MDFSSRLLENAVNEMAQLPGIGKRTALRLVLHLLKRPKEQTTQLVQALEGFRNEIRLCSNCHNISDTELCEICSNSRRDGSIICVVEDIRDVMAIENTAQFIWDKEKKEISSIWIRFGSMESGGDMLSSMQSRLDYSIKTIGSLVGLELSDHDKNILAPLVGQLL